MDSGDHDGLTNDSQFMDKYSRQIGAFGIETMAKLVRLKVLIVGMGGIGMETAKNLTLAGPESVTLCDDNLTTVQDLGANFFLRESDIGKPKAPAIVPRLQELNKMVSVTAFSGELTEKVLSGYNVVVCVAQKRDDLIKWNTITHRLNVGFIACGSYGASGYAFTDFGSNFRIHDATGELEITRIITDVSNEGEGLVSLLPQDEDGKMHELPDDDHGGWVNIAEVEGMKLKSDPSKSINDMGPFKIKHTKCKAKRKEKKKNAAGEMEEKEVWKEVFDAYRFRINDTNLFTPYEGGGMMTQFKNPFTKDYRPFEINLQQPVSPGEWGLMFTDGAKFGRAEQLHFAFMGLMEFEAKNGRLPTVGDEAEADQVVKFAQEHNAKMMACNKKEDGSAFAMEELDTTVIKLCAIHAAAELQPMCCFFGGVIAQEIVKYCGKFSPLNQWLHIDAFECYPKERPTDCAPQGGRYDHQITVFGAAVQNKLMNIKNFMVGCGALGCEFLKNFAMMGVGCGPNGLIHVTDNDRIEVSNLNRQFLFREHNVGQAKSTAATNAVKEMNPSLNTHCLEALVGPQTEGTFNDEFWSSLDLVTNALDNVKARMYVDARCVFYTKPLLESGTLGTKCNTQVILPNITESYSDGPKDSTDDGIPMCTLRNFPSLIEHCIEWARAQFTDQFCVPSGNAKKFVEDKDAFLEKVKRSTIDCANKQLGASAIGTEMPVVKELYKVLTNAIGITFERCIELAYLEFHALFRDKILQLIHNFPEDHTTSSGERFWSGAKKYPNASPFSVEDENHMAFLMSVSNLYAVGYGLQPLPELDLLPADSEWRDAEYFKKIVSGFTPPEWKPSGEKIAANDAELKAMQKAKQDKLDAAGGVSEEETEFRELLAKLEAIDVDGLCIQDADFEKDQDQNFHIDFVASTSNLRAANYRIKQATRHKTKMIAGKIIPAIATTTASVTGLIMLEFYKIMQDKPIEDFKNSSNSLGLNLYLMQVRLVAQPLYPPPLIPTLFTPTSIAAGTERPREDKGRVRPDHDGGGQDLPAQLH
jgi:ubiquitin-activating enzyme E1